MKIIIILVTVALVCSFTVIQKNNELNFNESKDILLAENENDEYWHDIKFPSGKTAQCKRIEGTYAMAYYKGPIESTYPCESTTGETEKRKLIILHDVKLNNPIMPAKEANGVLGISTIKPSTDPSTPDQWTYTNIKIEKLVSINEYDTQNFKRIEISYSEEKHKNTFFDRN